MIAEIISIGDELLTGSTVNTNASFIGKELTQNGMEVGWISTVGDQTDRILSTLALAVSRADVIILTGGLGPTHDDITRQVISQYFNLPLVFQPEIYQKLETYFHSRGRVLSPLNRVQAEIPQGAEVLENRIGTASGFYLCIKKMHVFVLPGVPMEMRKMMQESVLRRLLHLFPGNVHLTKTLNTIGISESTLNEKFKSFDNQFPNVQLASLPNQRGVSLRLSIIVSERISDESLFQQAIEFTREAAGRYLYGEDDDTLEAVVGRLLLKRNWSIAVAESCTGGLISHLLTNIPGSSSYFERGYVTYSNQSKIDLLQVPESIIQKHGAVSSETALAMAEGILKVSNVDVGLSITGIAGPTGGTREKPVGLVYIGYADKNQTAVEKYIFTQDRMMNKTRSAGYALDFARRMLQDSA
ncbi:competence/damage-inducible protein A [bacterium]